MHIGLIAFGTRGDVQPVLALAKGLNAAGHHARIIAGKNFGDWVHSHSVEFAPINVDMQALMQGDAGVEWVESKNPREELANMRRMFEMGGMPAAHDMLDACGGLDALAGGLTSDCVASAIAEKKGLHYFSALLQPMHPTRKGAATLRPMLPHHDDLTNKWMGQLAERFLFGVFSGIMNQFRNELGLRPHTKSSYYAALHAAPALNGFSQHVVPQPKDWPATQYITGYWFLNEETQWQPNQELVEFINAGPAPVYVGFGSATGSDAQRMTRLIVDALKASGQRGVIAQGWAGLKASDLSDSIYILKSAPHSWLFPRMAGVVHHGGAGTTAAGLRAGVPSLLIPHFADQPYWARRVHELGVGPKPIERARLSAQSLTDGIKQMVHDAGMRDKAAQLGCHIREEDGVCNAVKWIESLRYRNGRF